MRRPHLGSSWRPVRAGIALRGLTTVERDMLRDAALPALPGPGAPSMTTQEDQATDALAARGCVRFIPVEPDMIAAIITPRGRLALLCHQAVTAGMVST